jgi:LysR family transcriptional regulator, regulator for bpeEF and oprC
MTPYTLNVEAPGAFTRRLIAQSLPRFLHANPGSSVWIHEASRGTLLGPDMDAAICIGTIADTNLIATEVGAIRWMTCASPEFIECHGDPAAPSDLNPEHCIAVLEPRTHRAQDWVFRKQSETYIIRPAAPVAFCDADSAITSAVHGGGYLQVLSIEVEEQIAAGLLQAVLPDWNDSPLPVAIVYARDHASKDLGAFCSFVASLLPANAHRKTIPAAWAGT